MSFLIDLLAAASVRCYSFESACAISIDKGDSVIVRIELEAVRICIRRARARRRVGGWGRRVGGWGSGRWESDRRGRAVALRTRVRILVADGWRHPDRRPPPPLRSPLRPEFPRPGDAIRRRPNSWQPSGPYGPFCDKITTNSDRLTTQPHGPVVGFPDRDLAELSRT